MIGYVIAEIGTSHEGSVEQAKKLIDAAFEAGANAAKFQWVYADEILHPNTGNVLLPGGSIALYERFKQLECSKSFYKQMLDYTHSLGIDFICSPFGLKSLEELLELKPDCIKIASPELNHYPMLEYLAEYRDFQKKEGMEPIKVILSSGVSMLSDIEKAIHILGLENVFLLHCITSYPAPEDEYNLKLISNLKNIFGVETGVSDHSLDPVLVPSLAMSQKACIIEKHITLSRKLSGLDDPVALEPEQFALMCHCVRQCKAAIDRYGETAAEKIINQMEDSYSKEKVQAVLGSGIKRLAKSEQKNYGYTNRSLHYTKNLKAGDIIKKDCIAVLRTEKELSLGISPEFYKILTGSILKNDVKNGEGVKFSDFL